MLNLDFRRDLVIRDLSSDQFKFVLSLKLDKNTIVGKEKFEGGEGVTEDAS